MPKEYKYPWKGKLLTAKELAETEQAQILGLDVAIIRDRIRSGWTVDRTMNELPSEQFKLKMLRKQRAK